MWSSRSFGQVRGLVAGVIIGLLLALLLATLTSKNIGYVKEEPLTSHHHHDDDIWQDDSTSTAPVRNELTNEKLMPPKHEAEAADDEEVSDNDLHKAYAHVKAILFFIGYPRSRHSLLGSLLDAHPHMVVSDETLAFSRWKSNPSKWTGSIYSYYDSMFRASERAIQRGRRSHVFDGSVVNKSTSYGYYVPNQWQGRYDGYIEVVGDKAGAFTAGSMMKPDSIDAVRRLEKETGTNVKFIHVIRNPFDNIATMVLQHRQIKGRDGEHEVKIAAPVEIMNDKISQYFHWAEGSNKARMRLPGQVLDIPSMDIVKHPADILRKICAFLDIECSENYIQDCADTVDSDPSITRNFVEWPAEQKEKVYEEMKKYSFLRSYSFDN